MQKIYRIKLICEERPSLKRKITGDVDAQICAIACSEAPEGYKRWTLSLIANCLVELKIVDSISHESVRLSLKKRYQTQTLVECCWCMPLKESAKSMMDGTEARVLRLRN